MRYIYETCWFGIKNFKSAWLNDNEKFHTYTLLYNSYYKIYNIGVNILP